MPTKPLTPEEPTVAELATCYVAIWEDRHSDTEVYVFSERNQAIEWAKAKAREFDRHDELDEKLTDGMTEAGWLYRGCYSCEGDNIRVVKCLVVTPTAGKS